jgi:putative salt-induced outer membrane protein YdiY
MISGVFLKGWIMDYRRFVLFICLAGFCVTVSADEIVLKNGDRLTGKVKQLVDGKLVIESELAGTVTVELSNIQTLGSDAAIEIHLSDGTILQERILKSGAGQFSVAGEKMLKAQEFDVAAIASINPPAKPAPKWSGDISVGVTSTHGNTSTDSVTASVNLSKRTEKDRTQLGADYAKGRQENPDTGEKVTTEDWWRARAKYDYFFGRKLYGYLDGRYEKDSIADLDRRVIVGAGAGYQWIESDDMNFSTEAGLASRYEKFDNETESGSQTSLQLGYHFDKKLVDNVKFINDLTYYPSLEQFSDYFLTTTAEVRAYVTQSMFTNFKVIFNYDSTPAIGKGSTDTKYILGVGVSF